MNRLELLSKVPQYKAFRRGLGHQLPANMTFSVIDRCNMACRTCGIWKNRDTNEMTVEEYEEIVKPLNLFWVTISGGEPFMRDDIVDVLDSIVNGTNAQYVTIATNGMLAQETRETMEEVIQRTSGTEFVLNFSVDGTRETHEHMRRTKDAFQKVSNTIEEVRGIDSNRLNIGANTVVSKFNEDEISETYEDVQKFLDPDSFIAEVAEERDKLYNTDMEFAPKNPDPAIELLLEKLSEENRRGPARIVKIMRLAFYKWLLTNRELTNYTSFISAQCNPDGEVWPTSSNKKVMGNLRDHHDFEKLWRSRQAKKVRGHIREENPQDMLANSFYNNIICNPQQLIRLLNS